MSTATLTLEGAQAGQNTVTAWIQFYGRDIDGNTQTYLWAGNWLTDPSTYYGGLKEARVVSFGQYTRGLSDRLGRRQGTTLTFTLADYPDAAGVSLLRAFLGYKKQRALVNIEVSIMVISDDDRRAGLDPIIAAHCVVKSYKMVSGFQFQFTCQGWLDRLLSIPVPLASYEADFPNAPTDPATGISLLNGLYAPIVYGTLAAGYGSTPVNGPGKLPTVYVGPIDGTPWYGFLVCMGAAKTVTRGYQYGYEFDPAKIWPSGGTQYGFGGDDSLPNYHDVNGHRYTLVYAAGVAKDAAVSGASPITVDVVGYESVGDGSGTALLSIYDQMKHFLDNFCAPQNPGAFTTGWATTVPMWADGSPKRNDASFTTAKSLANSGQIANDNGAIAITDASKQTLDVLAQFALSADVAYGDDKNGAVLVALEPKYGAAYPATPTLTLDQLNSILAGTFDWEDIADTTQMYNRFPYDWAYDYLATKYTKTLTANDPNSQAPSPVGYGQIMTSASRVEYDARQDDAAVADLQARLMSRTKLPLRTVTVQAGLYALAQCDIGDFITITHPEGPGVHGYVQELIQLRIITPNLSKATVGLTCFDVFVNRSTSLDYPWMEELMAQSFGGSRLNSCIDQGSGIFVPYDFWAVTIDWDAIDLTSWKVNINLFLKNSGSASATAKVYVCSNVDGSGRTGSPIVTFTAVIGGTSSVQTANLPSSTGLMNYCLVVTGADSADVVCVKATTMPVLL